MDGGVIFFLAVMDVCATCIVRINAVEKTIMQLLRNTVSDALFTEFTRLARNFSEIRALL